MQYKLTKIDPDAPNEQYPIGDREMVPDPLEGQVHRNIDANQLRKLLLAALEIPLIEPRRDKNFRDTTETTEII